METLKGPILLTGGTGFVGSHLARALVKGGQDVHLVVRKGADTFRLADILSKVTVHTGSLSEKAEVERIVQEVKPTGIFHLAAQTIIPGTPAVSSEVIASNFVGTVNLLEALANIPYTFFIQSGTFLEYKPLLRPMKEDDLCEPKEVYGLTKLAATLYGKMIADTKGKPVTTFRFFTPYGPAIQKAKLVEQTIKNALSNKAIFLTRGSVSRDFLYTDDLVELLINAAENIDKVKGGIFNAGSGQKTSLGEFAELVVKLTGSKSKIILQPEKASVYDSDFWQADMTKTFSALSWRPKTSLEAGLQLTIDDLKKS